MNWKDNALVHAKDKPKEAVGLVLNIKKVKKDIFPCRNLSITANQCLFLIQKTI